MTTDFGYQLPTVINPEHTKCFVIHVPDDLYHIAAFKGQIWELTRWFNWAKDDAHTAILVAEVWKGIYAAMNSEDCCDCPPRIRLNGGILQWQDGAGDWHDITSGDERTSGTAPIPYPDNPDGACLAAENITALYQTALTQLRAGVEAAEVAVVISITITGILGAFISPAIVSTIALAIVFAALELGTTGLDTMLETTHLDNFKCAIYCHIEDDGSITASDFTDIRVAMADWASGIELTIINYWLDALGSVGLQRQALAAGITTGDCDACECNWTKEFDFTTGQHGWLPVDFNDCNTEYVAGVGFVSVTNGVAGISNISTIALAVASLSIRRADVTYGASGYPSTSNALCAFAWNDAGGSDGIVVSPTVDPDDLPVTQTLTLMGTMTGEYVRAQINVDGSTVATGTVTITKVVLKGVAPEPTWP